MASKILRKLMKQFGGSLSASGNIAIFGSQDAGSPGYSTDPVVIQSLAQYLQGWSAAVFGNNAPAKQDRNALDFLFAYQLSYLLQAGMAEYDPTTYYFSPNSLCVEGGIVYICYNSPGTGLIGVDPATDVAGGSGGVGNNWQTLASTLTPPIAPQGAAKAWACMNGSTGALLKGFNVSSVSVSGTGQFILNFPPGLLADSNYCVQLSCSNDNNHPYDPFFRFNGDLKSPTQLLVRNVNGNDFSAWAGNLENYVTIFD